VKSNNQILNPFISNEFLFISDIIVLDEPILSHYIRKDKNYFLYLVDKVNAFDKYLLFQINDWLLCEYLSSNISLLKLIKSNEDFIHLLDIDFDGNLLKTETFDISNLDNDYLPTDDSFIDFKPVENSFYYKLIEEHNNYNYINDLKKDAFYIKFSPNTSKYGHTVGFKELSETILNKISDSFSAFTKFDFSNKFNKKITDTRKLIRTFSKINDETDFRIVSAEIHSFELGLAVDKKMKMSIEDKEIREWAIDIGNQYKNILINTDFNSENDINPFIENFNPLQRRKIFGPLFEIIENKNLTFEVKKEKKDKFKQIKIKDKFNIEKIIPNDIKEVIDTINDFEIIQVTTLASKGKELKTIKIDNNSLFSSTNKTSFNLKYEDFVKHGYDKVNKDIQINLNIFTNQGTVIFETFYDNQEFKEVTNSEKLDDGIKKITKRIYEYILEKEE